MKTLPDALKAKQAADMIGVSEQRVRTLLRAGAIEGRQFGKQWLTTESAIKTYQNEGATKPPEDRSRQPGNLPKLKALSFFSGAMGLDQGLEKDGIHLLLACEFDKTCRRTIIANRPDIALLGDIWKYDSAQIRLAAGLGQDDEIDVMVGGPPCQAFSTAGARRGFHDERGNAFLRYVDLILEMRPRFAVIENVRGLLSAPMAHTPHSARVGDWKPEPEERPGGALMAYGMTETVTHATNGKPAEGLPTRSMGRVGAGYEFAVVAKDTGELVGQGEVGELWLRGFRGIQLFLEYFGNPEANASSFEGDWFKTGDMVMLGEGGNIFYKERDKDLLKAGGENVSAREVEDAITGTPGVSAVAVVGEARMARPGRRGLRHHHARRPGRGDPREGGHRALRRAAGRPRSRA